MTNSHRATGCGTVRVRAKWAGAELNRRHQDFQSCALPTELPALRRNATLGEPETACKLIGQSAIESPLAGGVGVGQAPARGGKPPVPGTANARRLACSREPLHRCRSDADG